MVNPNTIDLIVAENTSRKVIVENPFVTVNMARWLTAPNPTGAAQILLYFMG